MPPTFLRSLLPAALVALAATSSLVARPAPAAVPAPAAASPRPVVLLVHGRGQSARDTAALRGELRAALQAGSRSVAGAELLEDDDVRLVWYADAVGPRADAAPCPATAAGAAGAPAAPGDGARAFVGVLAAAAELVFGAVDTAESSDARELRALVADVHYLGEPSARCAAERRLGDALARARAEGRPVVLVAHSFGAIVSWGHLTRAGSDAAARPRIERFVTVGSPLAASAVRELVFGDAGRLAVPPGVGAWVNVVADGDPLAVPLVESDSVALPPTMTDVRASSPDAATHDFGDYLRDASTARAIATAWCSAAGRAAPSGCASLR